MNSAALNPVTDSFRSQLKALQARVDAALEQLLPAASEEPQRLHQAMRYSVINGGKRIRPILVYASGQALGIAEDALWAPACAVELIHAYSLIHDDLPAMDDDDLRRGQPTCHKAFDEATAILAGDALHALAFEALVLETGGTDHEKANSNAGLRLQMIKTLAIAAGPSGMVGGQAIDLAAVNRQLDLQQLEQMHRMKTGALIEASVILPTFAAHHINKAQRQALRDYARHIGLAFQIQDDILDAIGDTAVLGKTQGSDMAANKPTYYSLLGLDGAREKLAHVHQAALQSLDVFDTKADLLRQIADYIVERTH